MGCLVITAFGPGYLTVKQDNVEGVSAFALRCTQRKSRLPFRDYWGGTSRPAGQHEASETIMGRLLVFTARSV